MMRAINIIPTCCSATGRFLWNTTKSSVSAVNETIHRIGLLNISLFTLCLGFSIFQHNIIILSGIIGGIFNTQVDDMTKKISKLFNYYLHIVEPLLSFKIYNWRVLFPVVHGGVLFISIIALTILKPVSTLILPPIFCGAMFGANLVNSALRVE